ncbi:MAG: type II toxin-antitoxin system VapC family toxin [Nitrososphaerota archaeon]|nr:type II toxin-antitoxin system VapC family toxin [Nitrososphaerota archaeon]
MSRLYLDSNVFFYAKIMDRTFGMDCARVLRSVSSGETKASISTLVPLEVANAMSKFGLGPEAPEEIRAIFSLGLEVYPVESTDVREVAETVGGGAASVHDCTHAVVMRRYGIREVVSADKDFDKFPWVNRIDPRDFEPRTQG